MHEAPSPQVATNANDFCEASSGKKWYKAPPSAYKRINPANILSKSVGVTAYAATSINDNPTSAFS